MPYYDVANLVTVRKTDMMDVMPCAYGTQRTTGVRIRQQVSRRPEQRSPQLQRLTILIVNSRSILNAPPSLQVLSGARENALAQSEIILQSSRGSGSLWNHLEGLASATGVSERFAYGFRPELHFADVDVTTVGSSITISIRALLLLLAASAVCCRLITHMLTLVISSVNHSSSTVILVVACSFARCWVSSVCARTSRENH